MSSSTNEIFNTDNFHINPTTGDITVTGGIAAIAVVDTKGLIGMLVAPRYKSPYNLHEFASGLRSLADSVDADANARDADAKVLDELEDFTAHLGDLFGRSDGAK